MFDFERENVDGGALVIRASGKLDGDTTDYFFSCVKDELAAGNNKIVLNLQDVGYISSVGLGALVRASSEATKHGGIIHLSNIENKLLDILRLVKFQKLFNIYQSEQEAVLALST